jgi:tripartite-type tricarboxylate transporter receptor subunit TctC
MGSVMFISGADKIERVERVPHMNPKFFSYACRGAVALALLACGGALAQAPAQPFPARPVRLIVGTNPAGGIDIVARLVAAKLQEAFGTPVIVENRPGASGAIAAEFVGNAAPDGHTLLCAFSGQMVMNPVVQEKTAYDPVRDFEPVSMLGLFPVVLVANATVPANSVAELIGYAKAHPGKLNYASGSSAFFFVAEAFKQATGTDMRNIPYTGSAAAVKAVLADTVHFSFVDFPPAIGPIRSGRLKALGVTTARRLDALPEVPAVAQTLPGFEFVLWTAMFAPARTPGEVVARLQREIVRAVDAPESRERMQAAGVVPSTGTPQALAQTLRRDLELITRLARPGAAAGK